MFENKEPKIVEEDETEQKSNKSFFKVGSIVIGTILILMIICVVGIVIFENI